MTCIRAVYMLGSKGQGQMDAKKNMQPLFLGHSNDETWLVYRH